MKVAVGSKNPTKLEAVKIAFQKIFPKQQFLYETFDVSSGIPDQPKRDRETIRGATNRAKRALKAGQADFGVGLEGGLHRIGKEWFETGWIVIIDKTGKKGIGSSLRIPVPGEIMNHIHQGIELGDATDIVFKKRGSKTTIGFFGLMTNEHITRITGYADGVIAALSAFVHKELF